MLESLGHYASFIGLLVSLLALIYAYLAAQRSKISSLVLSRTNANQEIQKCSNFIKHIKRILIKNDLDLTEELLHDLRKNLLSISTKYEKVLPEKKVKKELTEICNNINSTIYAIQYSKSIQDKFDYNKYSNLLEHIDDTMITLFEEIGASISS